MGDSRSSELDGADAPARRPRRRLLWTLVSVAVVAVIAAAAVLVALYLDEDALPAGIPPQPQPIVVDPQIDPVTDAAPVPTEAGISAALAQALRNPDLGEFTGQIADASTGLVLWSQGAADPRIPASNMKVVSGSAALLGLAHDQRQRTTVVDAGDGELVLVGAGDPTLSAQPTGSPTFYTDAPRIADLVEQIKDSGMTVSSVSVDTSLFTGPDMARTWDDDDIAGGDIAPIQALMIDGARLDPLDEYSPRTDEPALAAGQAFADALGVTAPVGRAQAPAGAPVVASVESAPLQTRVNDMMRLSDNVLAETLSIELSMARGGPASLAGGTDAVTSTLREHRLSMNGVVVSDASGLSYANRATALVLDELMTAAAGPSQPELRPILDGLPVAAGTGTLTDRFDPESNPGAGWVRAKTGTLTGVSSLTGIVQTADGRVLSFAMISGGTSPIEARPALDAVAGTLRECGCR